MLNRFQQAEIETSLDNIGADRRAIRAFELVLLHNPPVFIVPMIAEAVSGLKRNIKREQARIDLIKQANGGIEA